ncbi:MAG: hypothetical protein J3R72DRAFT_486045 [Linnemannia gamsii]|nr:MAG: hypothetical protein J3R72DRAFT_486045 [Linnemannia gamsii]
MSSDIQDKMATSSFLPSSAINRFMILQSRVKEPQQSISAQVNFSIWFSFSDRICFRSIIDLPMTIPRAYDVLPPPDSKETHKYIASSRLLQKTALVKALEDADCGRVSLVERDFEYLRDITPDTAQGQDATSLVEADLTLDEHTAVIFHPLGDLGQAAGMDVKAGLNTLVATLALIGPRYKSLWLIFEEYYTPVSLTTSTNFRSGDNTKSRSLPRAPLIPANLTRPNPYTGPTMTYLSQFMAWVPITQTRTRWLSRIRHSTKPRTSQQQQQQPQQQQQSFGVKNPGQAMDEVPFETQVLFASDERCAARMVRAIGEGIVRRIDRAARNGVRRDEDGWRDAEEWLWRDWLNDQDSTHERFLNAFRLFNPFSIQLILSLCSLKEFFAMDHQQRCKTVGRFIDHNILAIFDKVVATPIS